MSILLKYYLLFCVLFLLVFSCANSQNIGQARPVNKPLNEVGFTEIRRLNKVADIKEAVIINSTKEIKELYTRLDNTAYSRSAPIPVLANDQGCFLILKPKLKNIKNGDIEVEKLESDGSTLIVNYKEVENWEYAEKKQSDPILILKILNKPNLIKLNQIN
ncbi:hypothetical protein M2347_002802 [Chryseobacterium sp. H1D6B]|uniref:hypothetical protein n=1 Tax=Chryseobacterium sp. H1D6B TaxID=2940588 RepID=UPI0015CB5CC8|nr:hypothetical protein [Chryseobacterium sp. H1D6B]MDH6253075.1 hypothetical protein [Chryseobacterium sp. H1D6B]